MTVAARPRVPRLQRGRLVEAAIAFTAAVVVLSYFLLPGPATALRSEAQSAAVGQLPVEAHISATFELCVRGWGTNCVIDGDTIRYQGEKIRLADIDAPETYYARCDSELALGNRAKDRLLQLVNAGPFDVVFYSRDRDVYGRKLRLLERHGVSFGGVLVSEGLARLWDGARHPWCDGV